MMSQQTDNKNMAKPIIDLVSQPFVIPIYQRNYNWGVEEVTQLLQDIYESYNNDNSKEYFLGSLVVFKRPFTNIYEVIDGQQRLTTLHIILNLLWDSIDKAIPLAYDSRPEVVDFFSHLKKEQLSFKVRDEELIEPNLVNFLKAIEYVLYAKLESDIHSTLSIKSLIDENKIQSFTNYLLTKVILVEVVMPEDTDVASYFEIMNNRGKQLEEHEIIKAQMMSNIKGAKQRQIFGKIWDACSEMNRPIQKFFTSEERLLLFGEEYDAIYPKKIIQLTHQKDKAIASSILDILKNPNQNLKTDFLEEYDDELDEDLTYTAVIDFSNFLIHVLKLVFPKVDIPLSSDKLLKIYQEIPKDQKEAITPIDFVQKLFFYRVVFDRFVVKSAAGLENNELTDDDTSNISRWTLIKPVMYWKNTRKYAKYYRTLNFKNSFEDHRYQDRLVQLLSMLQVTYRQRKNKNYLQYILSLFNPDNPKSIEVEAKWYLENLENFVLNQFDKQEIISYIFKIEEDDFTEENVYSLGTHTPHFIFNFIDYLLWVDKVWNNADWDIMSQFEFTYRNSVEHHFPQAQEDMLQTDNVDKEMYLHCLGNLCLISKGANSKLNDRSAWDKATDPRYSRGALTPKRKIMYNVTQKSKWNTDQIKDHYIEIINLLNNREDILTINS